MSDDAARALPNPLAPWPSPDDRARGEYPAPELFEDVPPHMQPHLFDWLTGVLREEPNYTLARSVLSRLRVSWKKPPDRTREVTPDEALLWLGTGWHTHLSMPQRLGQIHVLDAIVGMHPAWNDPMDNWGGDIDRWVARLKQLSDMLRDCGSVWQFDIDSHGLLRRVDPTATEAWKQARDLAESSGRTSASRYLAQAWQKVYGVQPDPVAAYNAAVKAVEAVAVEVIQPGTDATIHGARRVLHDHPERWQFVIVHNKSATTGTIDVVDAMLERLLRGETERHTSGENNRPNTSTEAEAVVHLAVVLVQWFLSGAVQPRT